MVLRINPNWRDKDLKCYFCGETRSVKYITEVVSDTKKEVCICNKCAGLVVKAFDYNT